MKSILLLTLLFLVHAVIAQATKKTFPLTGTTGVTAVRVSVEPVIYAGKNRSVCGTPRKASSVKQNM